MEDEQAQEQEENDIEVQGKKEGRKEDGELSAMG